MVRLMKPSDVDAVVKVHTQAFHGFFLTFLGAAFLRELYSGLLLDASGIAYVYDDGAVRGFVAGTDNSAGFYMRLLRQRWWRFGLASVGAILRRPSIIPRLLRAVRVPAQDTLHERRGILMSIAVYPDFQGKHCGSCLVNAFLSAALQRNLAEVILTTDQDNNERANYFYQKLGFELARSFITPEGRRMNEYIIDLTTRSSYREANL